MRRYRWALLLLAGALVPLACADRVPRVAVGEQAPVYSSRTLAGDSITLAQMQGRVVLLNLWATWCFPCREEIPELQALHERYGEAGLDVVGVSIDSRGMQSAIREFADEFGVTYAVWHDPDNRISQTFLAYGVPTTFLIDRAGVIRWRHMGVVRRDDPGLTRALQEAL
jgi:cytochrome c biogenesis protein CcmG, thiol:disulfide interchange protein DsbE